jgi:N-acetylmuramoyl-L-alanine amidase
MGLHGQMRVVLILCIGFFFAWTKLFLEPACADQGEACLEQVRYWSSAQYTRVVLDLDREVDYRVGSLDGNASAGKPPRIYVDLPGTGNGKKVSPKMELTEGPVERIRFGRHDQTTVRVVLDLRQAEDYNVFRLEEPFRVVLDLWWTKDGRGKADPGTGQGTRPGTQADRPALPLIVLDPGHGGNDPGAIGKGGLQEKDVVLAIAKHTKSVLEGRKKARVILTRDGDRFLPLENRAWIANSKEADLFVSIHANAHPNRSVRGVETYYLDNTTDKAAMRVAALENNTTNRRPDDLGRILIDLRCNSNAWESNALAITMQEALTEGLRRKGYSESRDLGAKGSLFYVLIGAHMPSILVEVAFITNPLDEKRLQTPAYRQALAEGIAEGIMDYLEETRRSDLMARQDAR